MNYPLLDVFLSMFWFFLWVLWIFLVVRVILDIFRSDDMSGWAKAGWTCLVILLPLFGVLLYLIVRGRSMQERAIRDQEEMNKAFDQRVRDAVGTAGGSGGPGAGKASELSKLSELHDRGVLTDSEFEREKGKILAA